jgi:hypothetical protein
VSIVDGNGLAFAAHVWLALAVASVAVMPIIDNFAGAHRSLFIAINSILDLVARLLASPSHVFSCAFLLLWCAVELVDSFVSHDDAVRIDRCHLSHGARSVLREIHLGCASCNCILSRPSRSRTLNLNFWKASAVLDALTPNVSVT